MTKEAKINECVNELVAAGMPKADASTVVDCLATADEYGVTTHGLNTLPSHLDLIKAGGYNLYPRFATVRETSAFALVDGDNAIGMVSAVYCMQLAMEHCRDTGIFTVWSRNNNTFGPAFYYPLLAARQGLIGFICSNSPAQMAPVGGMEKKLGTNPFAAVIPVPDQDPLIIDMATSVVAKSKFKEYKQLGESLPAGWALDGEGHPTTDPDEAIKGFVLPMAGYKGQALAMLIDVMSGILSGSAYLDKVGRFYQLREGGCMNVGFHVAAVDPYVVLGDDFDEFITEFMKSLRCCKTADGAEISLPGDRRHAARRCSRADMGRWQYETRCNIQ